ncbi:RapA-like RNA polymerase-associated protein [Klebsiella phage Miami]|uniref:RapA-like RNA polymerase-associated protein n=1 Tax=Klebsiella phage Miami TaxID=2767581 RepID=A0A873WCZ3_9CAUD|nr:RapA-like RNA polymerase-associated protein [Klebsiella phage Miami]QPB09309.1 RapA-like RNA polymerase-associated protein [Klebsiella phage Miami]
MLNYIFGPDVKQGPTITEINHVNFRNFNDDIQTAYGTSTPGRYMFRRVGSNKFVTDNFFLLELDHLITKILQSRNTWSSRKNLNELQIKLRTDTWIKDTVTPTAYPIDKASFLKQFKIKPYDTQWGFLSTYKMVKKSHHLKGLLLDAKAGSGKTFTSLMWTRLTGNKKHIIICPDAGINTVWKLHMEEKVFVDPPKYWSTRQNKPFDPSCEYFLIHIDYTRNPDFFKILDQVFEAAGKGGVSLVVDESHNFNELSSKQTQNIIKAADHYPFNDALPMSGTPLKAMAREAYSIFALIDPFFKGNARERFMKSYGLSRDKLNTLLAHRLGRTRYVIDSLFDMGEEPPVEMVPVTVPNGERFTLKAIRLEMLSYIQNRVKFYEQNMPMFLAFFNHVLDDYESYVKDDNGKLGELVKYKQIVNRFRTHGYNNFTDSADSQYAKNVEIDIEARLRGEQLKQFRNIKSAVKYVGLKIRGEALGNVLGKARIEAVRAVVAHAGLPSMINNVEKKTLIFTSYVDVLNEVYSVLNKEGFKPLLIYGDADQSKDILIKRFDTEPDLNPAVTTFRSLRESAHMVVANQEILMDAPWRDYELKQTKARIFRQGQDKPCFFWMIELDTGKEINIMTRSIDILQWSRDNVEELLSQSTLNNPSLRAIGGEEALELMDLELPTLPLPKSASSVLDLF